MTDPAAPAADTPEWDDARGPHLPDRLTAVPLPAWPFVLIAVVQVASIYLAQGADIVRDPAGLLIGSLLYATPKVASCLFGAALFIRHPDAARTLPMVAFAVSLFAVEQTLGMLYSPLRSVAESMSAAEDDGTFLMLASSAYSMFSGVVGLFALLYLSRGLDAARRFEGGLDRRVGALLLVAAVVTIGIIAVEYVRMPTADTVGGPGLLVVSLLITAATYLATIYLTTVAHAGRQAGEEPSTGWTLAASYGFVTIIAALVIVVGSAVWAFGDSWVGLAIGYLYAFATAAAALLLLGAFAVGLPSTEPVEPEPDDVDDASDDPAPVALPAQT